MSLFSFENPKNLKRLKLWQQCSKKLAATPVTGGTLEHSGHCASQSRARETISLTHMLRQQPSLDVEVHAPRSLLVPPLPPSNALSSRFERHTSPLLSHSLFRSLSSSLIVICVLLSPYALSLLQHNSKIVSSVDSALRISETYKVCDLEIGHVFVPFFYEIVISLLDCMLIDWGIQETFSEKSSNLFRFLGTFLASYALLH
ncbi:hypothetical protein VIGAN_06047200 [Vigna angularis var. angularis]|uniref:Uncharacterized protein n=1 Tax=Vigna angularis var. angularis TaxID=157739 RepID=A0A0S3S9M7_PHAAN|nr:uncharacterized protein LOC108339693 [Vigna angularis]BAT89502.1 hypothetical protein VIGAN_06047200 [Vigna angularis var. angularis]